MTESEPVPEPDADWWTDFHHPAMADMFLTRRSEDELSETADGIERLLRLPPSAVVFDQCCGIGNVAGEIARRGHTLVGCDLYAPYIERGRREQAGLASCSLHVADAFTFVAPSPCDGVFNVYSSFGYAADDGRNETMMRRAFESLRPGGWYAVETVHVPALLRGLQRCTVHRAEVNGRAMTLLRETDVDLSAGLLRQTWTWLDGDRGADVRASALRLYLPHQLGEMMGRAGFETVTVQADWNGGELNLDSPRLVVCGRRPEDADGPLSDGRSDG